MMRKIAEEMLEHTYGVKWFLLSVVCVYVCMCVVCVYGLRVCV